MEYTLIWSDYTGNTLDNFSKTHGSLSHVRHYLEENANMRSAKLDP